MHSVDAIRQVQTGEGRIVVHAHGSRAVFSQMSSTYPLKLLSPRVDQDLVSVVYAITYGGGLVGGDQVSLFVDVGAFCTLLLLSQGSTKIFKSRPGRRAARPRDERSSANASDMLTSQNMDFTVAQDATLLMLPDPITCFEASSYSQKQSFRLVQGASLVVLDWITSGRRSLGEEWLFSRYYSAIEVWVDDKRVARDVMLLENTASSGDELNRRPLLERLAPYSCYATLIFYGPATRSVVSNLLTEYQNISIYKTQNPSNFIWSLSGLSGDGYIVRLAGKETEGVRLWLQNNLQLLQGMVGMDVYRRAFV